jgi:hypothetical protein
MSIVFDIAILRADAAKSERAMRRKTTRTSQHPKLSVSHLLIMSLGSPPPYLESMHQALSCSYETVNCRNIY